MKRRDFFKGCSSLAGAVLMPGQSISAAGATSCRGIQDAFDRSDDIANGMESDIEIIGIGGFGSRLVSRITYEIDRIARPGGNRFVLKSIELDDQGSENWQRLMEFAGFSRSRRFPERKPSCLIQVAGLGGGTATTLAPEIAEDPRHSEAFSVAIVSMPRTDRNGYAGHSLSRIVAATDLSVVFESPEADSGGAAQSLDAVRARGLLLTERRMCQCATELIRAINSCNESGISLSDLRSHFSGVRLAGFGVAGGGYGQEIQKSVAESIRNAIRSMPSTPNLQAKAALVAFSGKPGNVKWTAVQSGKDEIHRQLGDRVPCLYSVPVDGNGGHYGLRTAVWLAFG